MKYKVSTLEKECDNVIIPYLSRAMNLTKSLWGGFGMSPAQEQSVSSSVPNPLYGGTLIVSVENQKLWLDFQRSEFEIIKEF